MKFFLLILVLFVCSLTYATDVITVRSNSWEPFNGTPNSKYPGYVVEIMQTIFKDYTLDYQIMDWEASLTAVRNGQFDAVICATKSEASDFIFAEEEVGMGQTAFIAIHGSNWRYTGIESLDKICLGVVGGYKYGKAIDEYIEKNKNDPKKVVIASGDDPLKTNMENLAEGKVQVILEVTEVFKWKAAHMYMTDVLGVVGYLEENEMLYVAFSPAKESSKKYAQIFSDGMKELRKSKKLEEILNKYKITDWKK